MVSKHELDDVLLHFGIKGMKWGVRRSGKGQNGSKVKKKKKPGIIRKEWDSLKRERQWSKVLKKVDTMSTRQINSVANRVQLENDLKRLTKTLRTSRKDYVNRGKMSNQELLRKVSRLRATEALSKNASQATKAQREFGKKVVEEAGKIVLKSVI